MFVIIGDSGIIIISTSVDGNTWGERTSTVSDNLFSIAYGNGLFVSVGGNGIIITGSNGSTWTLRSSELATKITYGNNLFVAVGNVSKTIIRSIDGITWEVKSSGVANWLGIAYGNNLFVAVGNNSTTVATSRDGITWTVQTTEISSTLTNVFYNTEKNKFIIIENGKIHTCNISTLLEIRFLDIERRLCKLEPFPVL
jgi:hypothetical protein